MPSLESRRAGASACWTAPRAAVELSLRDQQWEFVNMAIRACAATALAMFVLRSLLAQYTAELPWDYFLWIFPLVPLVFFLLAALALRVQRYHEPGEYAIISDGILVPSSRYPLLSWKRLDSYTIGPHPTLTAVKILCVHHKEGHTRPFALAAESKTTEEVLKEFANRLPQRPPLPKHSPLERRDWGIGFSLLIAFTLLASALIEHFFPILHGHGAEMEMALLLIGPGTLLAPFLWRKRAAGQIISITLMLNMIACLTSLSAGMILHTTRLLPRH